MIRFLFIQNKAGKTRLSKWYVPIPEERQRIIEADVHRLVTTRDKKFTNFIEYEVDDSIYKIIYRRYAGLYFSLCVDTNDNELAYLEAIHHL